jgi:hypothetical protein
MTRKEIEEDKEEEEEAEANRKLYKTNRAEDKKRHQALIKLLKDKIPVKISATEQTKKYNSTHYRVHEDIIEIDKTMTVKLKTSTGDELSNFDHHSNIQVMTKSDPQAVVARIAANFSIDPSANEKDFDDMIYTIANAWIPAIRVLDSSTLSWKLTTKTPSSDDKGGWTLLVTGDGGNSHTDRNITMQSFPGLSRINMYEKEKQAKQTMFDMQKPEDQAKMKAEIEKILSSRWFWSQYEAHSQRLTAILRTHTQQGSAAGAQPAADAALMACL